ncbi:SH3 domain-containing protein [Colwellia sp. E2M01]|uniref:SH3 domain-containing protein n=1 Tax=Colwellia sp. E2M01 TaxID=2841561 RepID=UPI001C087D25|nr:SH3 domain-containing protein [Colwellia sp. E2M01]MBU2870790.1 outer membrane beta-barrel protein [Colwellia sp. E2M01]
MKRLTFTALSFTGLSFTDLFRVHYSLISLASRQLFLNSRIMLLMTMLLFCASLSANENEQSRAEQNSEQDLASTLIIKVAYVELHSGPGIGYPVIHVVEQGEHLTVDVKRTSWLKVTDKRGNVGWLHQDELLGLTTLQNEHLTSAEISWNDFQGRDFEAGFMYGNFDEAHYYSVQLAYFFSSVFSGELSAGKALGAISNSDIYEAMLISQPLPELLISPYVGIGGGIIKTNPHSVLADSEKRQNTLMSAAFGLKYHLARNFIIRAEYKYSLALTDRDDNEEIQIWKLGFSVFF